MSDISLNKEMSIRKENKKAPLVWGMKSTASSAKELKMREWFFETFNEQNAYPN